MLHAHAAMLHRRQPKPPIKGHRGGGHAHRGRRRRKVRARIAEPLVRDLRAICNRTRSNSYTRRRTGPRGVSQRAPNRRTWQSTEVKTIANPHHIMSAPTASTPATREVRSYYDPPERYPSQRALPKTASREGFGRCGKGSSSYSYRTPASTVSRCPTCQRSCTNAAHSCVSKVAACDPKLCV